MSRTRCRALSLSSRVVVEGYAIFGGMNHRVFAHSIDDGYTKWSYQMSERIFIDPVISGPNVFVADQLCVTTSPAEAFGPETKQRRP